MESSLADRLFDGLLEVDSAGRVTYWNRSAERITGYLAEKVLGQPMQKQPARHTTENGTDLPDNLVPLLATVRDGCPREAIGYLSHADGYRLTLACRIVPLADGRGHVTGAVEVFTDNKALVAAMQAAQATEETVRFDPLTGIGNRPHIEAKIRSALEGYNLHGHRFGILFIDVDHFKEFNDTYGHLLGDKLLRMAANTLRQNLRGSDSCGRWGGEEFVALVHDLDQVGLRKVAEKLRINVSDAKVHDKNRKLGVTISVGASMVRPADNLQSLLERADRLMYESKRLGRNRVTVDEPVTEGLTVQN